MERLERDSRRAPHAHLRPTAGVHAAGPQAWWHFAVGAVRLKLRSTAMEGGGGSLQIAGVMEALKARRVYVDAYARRALSTPRPKVSQIPPCDVASMNNKRSVCSPRLTYTKR